MQDTDGNFHVSLVMSKTKVAPIKRITIPRLELCGAHLLSQILVPFERYSTFTRLQRVTAWVNRFVHNYHALRNDSIRITGPLTVKELKQVETDLVSASQEAHFAAELSALRRGRNLPSSSYLRTLRPFLDSSGVIRLGGRGQNSEQPYYTQHPIILHGKHLLTRLIIRSEHLRLLHAGATLLTSSLCRRFYVVGCRKIVRSITRGCATCRRNSARPRPPIMGQLPKERVTPDIVFDKVGIDYVGPVLIKHAHVRKPTIVKAYICVFVALSVKAVHLELVSDLTTEAFIACLRRFIARRGKPSLIWS